MSDPDVRVRLSAEGVQEVVSAIKQVAAQSKGAATGADSAFRTLNSTLKSTKQLMESFYILKLIDMMARVATGLVDFAKESLRAATDQRDLARQVGTTTASMSALSMVAVLARTKSEMLVTGMGHLGDALDRLRAGEPKTVAAFLRLGLAAKDFPGDDTAKNTEIFARALSHVADGGTRGAIVTDILGKGAKALLPLFQKLVELNGLVGAIQLAQRTGIYVSDIAAAQLDEMDMKLKLLQLQAQGAALSLFEGFGPSLIEVLGDADTATEGSRSGFEKFGEVMGVVLRVARAAVMVGLVPLVETVQLVVRSVMVMNGLTQLIKAGAPQRDITGFARAAIGQIGKDLEKVEDDAARAVVDIFRKPPPVPDTGDPNGERARAAAAAARLQQLITARSEELNSEIALLQEKNRTEEAVDAQAYENGLLSLDEYYKRRNDRINLEYAADLRRLALRRQEALAEPDPAVRALRVTTVDNEIQARVVKNRAEAVAFLNDYKAKRLAALREINSAEDDARAIQGRSLDSELRKLDEKEKAFRTALFLVYKDPAMADAEAKRVFDLERAKARFDDLLSTANREMRSFDEARSQIQQDVASGLISTAEGERRIADLESQRLPGLREIAAQLKDGAQALGPDELEKVDEYTAKIERLRTVVKSLGAEMKGAFKDALTGFLASGINQVHSLTDAFVQLGLSIANAIQQKAAEKIGGAITDAIFGAFGYAEGGYVSGPGTGTSDSIPARLSHGEYVVRAAATSMPGVLQTLEAINSGQRVITPDEMRADRHRHYAEGGLVTRSPGASQATLGGHITVGLEDGLTLRDLRSPEGQRALLQIVAKNPRAFKRALE